MGWRTNDARATLLLFVFFLTSLYMFMRLGGGGVGGRTEKARPCAWLGPWYGSCPMITTRTSSQRQSESALSASG